MLASARFARSARALSCWAALLGSAGCDGALVNLGRSQGLTGGGAGAQAGSGGEAPTWALQPEPIVAQTAGVLLANPTLTADLQYLFFTEQNRFGDTRTRVRRAERAGASYVNAATVMLGPLEEADVASPAISAEGDELWLGLSSPDGTGGTDIWRSLEAGDGFSTPELVAELSSAFDDAPRPTLGGLIMPLSSKRHGGLYHQVYLATRASTDDAWGEPSQALLGRVNVAGFQSADGFLASDGLELYFSSNREGLQSDLYVARREAITEQFGEPVPVSDLNSTGSEERMPWLSEDGRHLYFASNRSGQYALYRADR